MLETRRFSFSRAFNHGGNHQIDALCLKGLTSFATCDSRSCSVCRWDGGSSIRKAGFAVTLCDTGKLMSAVRMHTQHRSRRAGQQQSDLQILKGHSLTAWESYDLQAWETVETLSCDAIAACHCQLDHASRNSLQGPPDQAQSNSNTGHNCLVMHLT